MEDKVTLYLICWVIRTILGYQYYYAIVIVENDKNAIIIKT